MQNNRILIILFLFIALLMLLYLLFGRQEYKFNSGKSNMIDFFDKRIKNVIFDLGANIGDSALLFADPEFKCNNCHELKGICTKDNKNWIMHSFEANPRYNDILDNVTKTVKKYGHTHYLYKQSAAWTKNENLTFYIDDRPLGWGTSAHRKPAKSQTKIVVKAYDISEIIDHYSIDDYIVVKVDIEGTEFQLFEHFLRQGTINKIDYIAIEFHDIYKNQTFADKIKFYKTYLETVNKPYSQWFMGHRPFLPKEVFKF